MAENREKEAPLGSNVTLRCRTEVSENVGDVKWYRESVPLPASSRINGAYLHIYDLVQHDSGRYFCEVSGPQGVSTDYINLKVVGKTILLNYFDRAVPDFVLCIV